MLINLTNNFRQGKTIWHPGKYRVPIDMPTSVLEEARGLGLVEEGSNPAPNRETSALHKPWSGKPVIVAASGPSLPASVDDCLLSGLPIIAVNDAYRLLPSADILYACDYEWWAVHAEATKGFKGERWTSHDKSREDPPEGLRIVPGIHSLDFAFDGDAIAYGNNSGFQAVNLAFMWGASEVYLVGFDMRAVKGKAHFFGDHPKPLRNARAYASFINAFTHAAKALPPDRKIFNCTPGSALRCFPFAENIPDVCITADA